MHLGDNLCMNNKQAEKKFPLYFNNFEIPEWAREQELEVFRACATGKVDRESFMNSFEENGYKISKDGDELSLIHISEPTRP